MFNHVSKRLANNRDWILEQIKLYPQAMLSNRYDWLKRWRSDKELMVEAILHRACISVDLESHWLKDKSLMLRMIPSGKISFFDLSEPLTTDKDILLALLANQPSFSFMNQLKKFRKNREVMLAACRLNGRALMYATSTLKNDKALVLEAVRNTGFALEYASKR